MGRGREGGNWRKGGREGGREGWELEYIYTEERKSGQREGRELEQS